jgi:hypothetical protein
MPRVSSAPEDAYHLAGKFADGWAKITDAKALVFQFPPTKETKGNRQAGQQDPPALYVELTLQRYSDGEGNKTAAEPDTKLLGLAKPDKMTGALDAVHPGNYPDGNVEADPVDCGSELGAEGNTVYAVQDGYQFNDKCGWMAFTASLVEDGFKPQVLKRTYFPDMIGLYAYFETVTMQKFRADQTEDPTAFRIKKGSTKVYPYEQGAQTKATAAGKGGAKAGAAAAGKTTTAASKANGAPAPAAAADSGADSFIEDLATAVVTDTLAPAYTGQTLPNVDRLMVNALMAISKHKPAVEPGVKKALQDQIKNKEWLASIGDALGLFEVQGDGKVIFA